MRGIWYYVVTGPILDIALEVFALFFKLWLAYDYERYM